MMAMAAAMLCGDRWSSAATGTLVSFSQVEENGAVGGGCHED